MDANLQHIIDKPYSHGGYEKILIINNTAICAFCCREYAVDIQSDIDIIGYETTRALDINLEGIFCDRCAKEISQ